jgi:4-amino-4-deoxy-L-arabinose transferase-like glycosyltransferase
VILLVLVIVALAYRFWDLRQPWLLVAIGVVIGAATLARPELLLLLPLLVAPLAWWSSGPSVWRRLGWMAASGAAALVVIAPWVAFNLARFDEPVLLSQNLGGTLAGSYCETTLQGTYIGYWDFSCAPRVLDAAGITELGDERMDAVARDEGLRVARENLDRLPVVVAARLGRVAGVFRPFQQRDLDAETEGVTSWVATAGIVVVPLTLVAAAAGAVVLRRRGRLVLPLLAPIAVVVVTVVVFYGATRFRSTAEGPLYLLVAVAVDAVWRRFGRDGAEKVVT